MAHIKDPNRFLGTNVTTRYLDLDFNLSIDASGKVKTAKNTKAIEQSVKTILSTFPGERYMFPEFGSKLKQYLFDQMDIGTKNLMIVEIENSLERWEPRITVSNVDIIEDFDNNSYNITISYVINGTGETENFVGVVKKK
jgi:Bacteriophage baseplate protein W